MSVASSAPEATRLWASGALSAITSTMRTWWLVLVLVVIFASGALLACSSGSGAAACDAGACSGPGSSGAAGRDGGCWQPGAADSAYAEQFCSVVASCCVRMHEATPIMPTVAEQQATCSMNLLRWGFSRDAAIQAACLTEASQAAGTLACMPEL